MRKYKLNVTLLIHFLQQQIKLNREKTDNLGEDKKKIRFDFI